MIVLPTRFGLDSVNPTRQIGCVLFEARTVGGIALAQRKATASSLGYRRSIAASVAALVLLAQLIASAHVHPGLLLKGFCDGAHFLSDAVCPVSTVRFAFAGTMWTSEST